MKTTTKQEAVAVLGAGNMGTAMAQVMAGNGHRIALWSIEHDVLEEIRGRRLNTRYLPGIVLRPGIAPFWEIGEAMAGASQVIVTVPSQAVREVARGLAPHLKPGQIVLNVAKGLEAGTHRRMSEVLAEETRGSLGVRIASMGGPAIATEMARGTPMAVIAGSTDEDARLHVQRVLQNEHLKVATTTDVPGLEACATLKNVYAISLGMCDGLGHGTNTKAFLASLALEEMCAIACSLGGARETVYGLAGLGDLLTTGYSEHSRNRTLGELLGKSGDWRHYTSTHTVEGVGACLAVRELATASGLTTPLLETIHGVLYDGQPTAVAVGAFFRQFWYG